MIITVPGTVPGTVIKYGWSDINEEKDIVHNVYSCNAAFCSL
jgi:hypothetical protein